MAILQNVTINFVKCDPSRPNAQFSKKNPRWEVQVITDNIDVKNQWAALGLRPKLIQYKEGDPKEGEPILNTAGNKQWKLGLSKNSLKDENGTMVPATPPEVVDGNKNPVDPNTIGNGSVANVRVYLYEYPSTKEPGKMATGHILMGIQVVRHIVYTPKPREEFGTTETERIVPVAETAEDGGNSGVAASSASPTPSPTPSVAPMDNLPEDKF